MKIRYKLNPPERDERGEIPDFEKTWICFTVNVTKAPDERAANDALEFLEWHLNYESHISCALLRCVKQENGVYTDILTFDRDKRMGKRKQIHELHSTIKKAKAALYKELAAVHTRRVQYRGLRSSPFFRTSISRCGPVLAPVLPRRSEF